MKSFVAVACVALFVAAVYSADEEKKEGDVKIYKRLIPADVLRGKRFCF